MFKGIKKLIHTTVMHKKYNDCHRISHSICCSLGFNNDEKIQKLIDKAKDCLYNAGEYFKEESEKGTSLEKK